MSYNNIEFHDFVSEISKESSKHMGMVFESHYHDGVYNDFAGIREGGDIEIMFSTYEDMCECFESLKNKYIHNNIDEKNYVNEYNKNQTTKTCDIPIVRSTMKLHLHHEEREKMCTLM